ncbi:ejaculatory bulb-specific protein 3-like [Pseudomyrmex gracilis]|uniref:ejaculatory bulb-specific protein 3-like n=1 Tax=Pseudomyrmex gracilis TaxID=219809 RepID=UPI000995CA19|nr:ejaculatory bulb-specific protein 3-like [Pseudomyrmex gracilis]
MVRLSCVVAVICIALSCVFAEEEVYSTRYDDIDIHGILDNSKLRDQYYKCFMDFAPCKTADAKFFKEIVGEALQTECKKCSERQKLLLEIMIDWYTKNEPDKWQAFVAKTIEDLRKKNNKLKEK